MKRRQLLKLSAYAATCFIFSNPIQAFMACSKYDQFGVQLCEAGILSPVFAKHISPQHHTFFIQWSWAASLETILHYYGLQLSQTEIAAQLWGKIDQQPLAENEILRSFNREWTDTNGQRFRIDCEPLAHTPLNAAEDLSKNRPVLIISSGHAMVLTAIRYRQIDNGRQQIIDANVSDPWPQNAKKQLSAREWQEAKLLARIRVSRL
ncbi:papain-like cysteine protease family protein [Thaumasiovibrio subtropicus]|uniref:papain-like cysteine protease family protein n=1 Tax=Thaumasiovibrio subtropicus TaxID=1891207 RepID=UPI000B34C0F6|nr:papain-like cysteine protease family protein [Thaumasiovibrio subtropicus]